MSALRCLAARYSSTSPARSLARKYASEASLKNELKPTRFGQPLFASHPHLSQYFSVRVIPGLTKPDASLTVRPDEITPGISANEYERRRKALMDRLPDGSIVVSVSAEVKYMSGRKSCLVLLCRRLTGKYFRDLVRLCLSAPLGTATEIPNFQLQVPSSL